MRIYSAMPRQSVPQIYNLAREVQRPISETDLQHLSFAGLKSREAYSTGFPPLPTYCDLQGRRRVKMNNTQFRRLVLDTPGSVSRKDRSVSATTARGGATPALGSRMHSSIPMTPYVEGNSYREFWKLTLPCNRRSVAGSSNNEFARQLAERNASLNSLATKKFRSTAAPKGSKLGSGYQDRTKMLQSDDEDDKARRVKALEQLVKLGQMEHSRFEALRDEIVGGDIKNVHLVKGLDRKLLERVRRGEDVLSIADEKMQGGTEDLDSEQRDTPLLHIDVDEELEKMEEKEIRSIAMQQKAKQGELAVPQVAGKKRNRDDILKELRESRLAATQSAKQAALPTLGPKFTKFGQTRETSRIERDDLGREVLITVDENGKVKRKVKRAMIQNHESQDRGLLMPDKDAKPLGMEIAMPITSEEENENSDIFEGVGANYDPLAGLEDDEEQGSEDKEGSTPVSLAKVVPEVTNVRSQSAPSLDLLRMPPPPLPSKVIANKRNYFGDANEKKVGDTKVPPNNLTDPTIIAALKKASIMSPLSSEISSHESEEEAAKLARRKKMLEAHDRDVDDIDLGFGSSRFGDEDDVDGKRVKLSVWGKDGGDEGRSIEGKGSRKRGPKKRKGDANSAVDVLKIMERRKGEVK